MLNIDRIEKIIKKKKQKTSKIIKFLYQNYQKDNKAIFYRYGKRWMNFTVRELVRELDVSLGLVNKTLNLLKSADLVEYEFISYKGYGKRRNTHDNKSIFFTAKGRAILKVLLSEKSDQNSQEKKVVNTIDTKAVKLNNYNINKSTETEKKVNYYATESLCAKLYDEIERLNIPVKRNKATARYIHAAANKLACNRKIGIQIPTVDLIARFRKYLEFRIKWLKQKGYKVCLHLLLKFKAIGAFLAKLFAPYYNHKLYEKPVKMLPKRKILLEGEDIITFPDKYHIYCELYGKENIQVKINGKQATCLPIDSLENPLETLEILCGKENIVIINEAPHHKQRSKEFSNKRGFFGSIGSVIDKIIKN